MIQSETNQIYTERRHIKSCTKSKFYMKQRNTNVHASGAVTTSSRKRPSLIHQGRDILLEQQEGTGTNT